MSKFDAVQAASIEKDIKTVERYPYVQPIATAVISGLANAGAQLLGSTASDGLTLAVTLGTGLAFAFCYAIKARRATRRVIDFSVKKIEDESQRLKNLKQAHENHAVSRTIRSIDDHIRHTKRMAMGSATWFYAKTVGLAAFEATSVYLGGVFLPDMVKTGITWTSPADQLKLILSTTPTWLSGIMTYHEADKVRRRFKYSLPTIQTNEATSDEPKAPKNESGAARQSAGQSLLVHQKLLGM